LVALSATKRRFDPALNLSERIARTAYRNGLIFRAFNDNILGFAPALCYQREEFDVMFERLRKTLDTVLEAPEVRASLT
jgi:adenosylmethionine-8-amino-7-oxononanoate aminotransferase